MDIYFRNSKIDVSKIDVSGLLMVFLTFVSVTINIDFVSRVHSCLQHYEPKTNKTSHLLLFVCNLLKFSLIHVGLFSNT